MISMYVFAVCLTLCVVHGTLVSSDNVKQSTWLPVAVDMDHFLNYASLASTTDSESFCASLAIRKSADLYCFQPQQCYLPAGWVTAFRAGKTDGEWTCKSTKNRKLAQMY